MAISSYRMSSCYPYLVSGMQSIELGVSDKDMLEQYNLVWLLLDYDIDVTIASICRRSLLRQKP